MRGMVQPPCFCRCTGCELKGHVMFLHGWVSTCIWQASGETQSNFPMCCWKVRPQTAALLAARVNGVQTAVISVIFWTRAVEKRDVRKLEGTFFKRKIMERALHGEKKSFPEEKNEVENSKQFYCFYPSTFFCSFICGLFFFSIRTLPFLTP